MKRAQIKKPDLHTAETLRFATESHAGDPEGQDKGEGGKPAQKGLIAQAGGTRIFFAPVGDKRLTINIRQDLHKKLKIAAIEQGITAGEILEKLIEKHL